MSQCPLCQLANGESFFQDTKREYLRCPECLLVFVSSHYFLSPEEEKAEYDKHENSADDPGYRRFLGRMFDPLNGLLAGNSLGLDFGSGPGPTLSIMFEEAGHSMAIYDPFYASDLETLSQPYDFITATEVVEHLHDPKKELERLWGCLRPGGYLGIMTKRALGAKEFAGWHYKNDPTHVCFFAAETFEWLAQHWRAELNIVGSDVVIFSKL